MLTISALLDRSQWKTKEDGRIGRFVVPDDATAAAALNFVANSEVFIAVIRQITRCAQITRFDGRVYRMLPIADHYDSWHDDAASGDRLVGMSVNLGRQYSGGVFRLREDRSGKILSELPNTHPGDAIFFRICKGLSHIVTPVEGTAPKTAFAGWFRAADSDYYSFVRQLGRS